MKALSLLAAGASAAALLCAVAATSCGGDAVVDGATLGVQCGITLVQDRTAEQREQSDSACGTGAITGQSPRHPCRVVAKRPTRAQATLRQDRASVAAISGKLRRCVLYRCRVLDSSGLRRIVAPGGGFGDW